MIECASMTNHELTEFIAHARKKEMDHATIRMLLVSSGWKEKDVMQALANGVYNVVYKGMPYDPQSTVGTPLPQTLDIVVKQSGITRANDPETGVPYVYNVIDSTHFEVCAVFALSGVHSYDTFWDHPAGEKCYSFDIKDRQHVN